MTTTYYRVAFRVKGFPTKWVLSQGGGTDDSRLATRFITLGDAEFVRDAKLADTRLPYNVWIEHVSVTVETVNYPRT